MKLTNILMIGALGALVAGCGGKTGFLNRDAPDELLAGRQAPLVVPPDYNLQPPKPGAPRPLAPDARTEAINALFPELPPEPPKSAAETAILQLSGADKADPTARSTVGDPGTVVVNKGFFTKTLVEAPAGGDRAIAAISAN